MWKKLFTMFQRVKNQVACFLKLQLAKLTYLNFATMVSLFEKKFHDYSRTFYINYQNYYKQIFNLHFRPLFFFSAEYFICSIPLCSLSLKLE
jgi:hypothetical protein